MMLKDQRVDLQVIGMLKGHQRQSQKRNRSFRTHMKNTMQNMMKRTTWMEVR